MKTLVNVFDIVSRLGNNQARLVVSLTANDVAVVAVVGFIWEHKPYRQLVLVLKISRVIYYVVNLEKMISPLIWKNHKVKNDIKN